MPSPSKRFMALVLMIAIVMVAAILAFAIREARQAARRHQYSNNMKQVGLALLNFENCNSRFPPAVHRDKAGQPLCSWRLRVAPYVECVMEEVEFDRRWDAPGNEWASTYRHYVFSWPPGENGLHTNVVAITGRGTAFEEGRVVRSLTQLRIRFWPSRSRSRAFAGRSPAILTSNTSPHRLPGGLTVAAST